MTFAENILRDDLPRNQIGIIKPKTSVTGFSLDSGIVYSAPFELGKVVYSVVVDGTIYTEAADSSSVTSEKYFFSDGVLKIGSSGPPGYCFVTYGIYFSTQFYIFNNDPTDLDSLNVEYELSLIHI